VEVKFLWQEKEAPKKKKFTYMMIVEQTYMTGIELGVMEEMKAQSY
jgi:hypothetical protein